jgi:hypothetical protein
MKLNNSYLCADCDEVFAFKDQIYPNITHYPICPICGNKNVLNLGRVLNRQEDKRNEEHHRRRTDWCGNDPDGKHIIEGISGRVSDKDVESVADGRDQSGDRRSGRTDSECNSDSEHSNRIIKATDSFINVDGEQFQTRSEVQPVISGLDADPVQSPLPRREHSNRGQDLDGEAQDYRRGL